MLSLVKELELQFREKYMEYRREIHKNPELSYEEKKTSALVANVLTELGMKVTTGVGGYGVTALLEGELPGKVIGLRADMDALSIKEGTDVPWKSQIDGVMHACGHDVHTAILLGVAHVLSGMKDKIKGTVKFIFQPAEENSPTGGAPGMIRDGALLNPSVDMMLGLHVWPTLKTGTIGLQTGAVSAASDRLGITVKGKAAHASMPDTGVDAIVAGSSMVMALQTIVSRSISARDTAVLTLGTVKGGDRYNIISDRVFYDGTVRTFDSDVRNKMATLIERTAKGTCESLGASCEVDYKFGYPSAMNDPLVTEIAQKAVENLLGEENLLTGLPVFPGGEDFAFFAEKVPSAFAWLGCCPEGLSLEEMPKLHNEKFLPDDESMPIGVCFIAAGALELLERY